jgi:hypothetical protein
VRLGHGTRERLLGPVAVGALGERHVERHPDVGQPVAELITDLVGADRDVERLRVDVSEQVDFSPED